MKEIIQNGSSLISQQKIYLFVFKSYFEALNEELSSNDLEIKSLELKELIYKFPSDKITNRNLNSHLNDVLNFLFNQLKINLNIATTKERQFHETITERLQLRDQLIEKEFCQNYEKINSIVNLLSYLTDGFNENLQKQDIKYEDFNTTLYFISFIDSMINETNATQTLINTEDNKIKEFPCKIMLKENQIIQLFNKLLKEILLHSYSVSLDKHFIMRHRLYNYQALLRKHILNENQINKNSYKYTIEDIIILECEQDYLLQDSYHLYLITRILDNNLKIDKLITTRLKTLFWNTFSKLEFNAKTQVTKYIYENIHQYRNTFNFQANLTISCLFNETFEKESFTLINQLSSENIDSIEVI